MIDLSDWGALGGQIWPISPPSRPPDYLDAGVSRFLYSRPHPRAVIGAPIERKFSLTVWTDPMNSDRRHELKENELASIIDRINTSIEPYSKPIAVVVAVAFVGLLGWGFYSSVQAEHRSDATYQLLEGAVRGDSETLAAVAANYPDTPMAAWARVYQGSQKMGVGINALFTSRDEAEELLGEASSAYDEALTLSRDSLIQSRAHYGLARIAESLGKTDEAIAHYEATMDAGESEAMMNEAQQRITLLSKPAAKAFMTWFDEQDFTPADPSLPPALPADQMLPDLPDLDFPNLEMSSPPDQAAAAEEAMDESAAVQTENEPTSDPAPADNDAAETPDATETPAASDPAPDDQPMSEEPTTEEPTTEEPATEEPTTGEPATEEPTTGEPATEEPTTEEPVAESEQTPAEPADSAPEDTAPDESSLEESPATAGDNDGAVDLAAPANS